MSSGAEAVTDFFLRLNFELGINPKPQYGIERTQVATRVSAHLIGMARKKELPDYRNWLWIRSLPELADTMFDGVSTRDIEYTLALSDAYLDWLYSQPTG